MPDPPSLPPSSLLPLSAKEPVRFHAHMTIVLFIFDLLDAIPMVLSRTTFGHPWLCDAQGIAITILEVAIVLWNSFMALQVCPRLSSFLPSPP